LRHVLHELFGSTISDENEQAPVLGAIAPLLRSRLPSPRIDPTTHLFVRNGSARVRIVEVVLDHDRERQLAKDFVGRAIVWLVFDQLDQLRLGWARRGF
jgi:hypothetical protein